MSTPSPGSSAIPTAMERTMPYAYRLWFPPHYSDFLNSALGSKIVTKSVSEQGHLSLTGLASAVRGKQEVMQALTGITSVVPDMLLTADFLNSSENSKLFWGLASDFTLVDLMYKPTGKNEDLMAYISLGQKHPLYPLGARFETTTHLGDDTSNGRVVHLQVPMPAEDHSLEYFILGAYGAHANYIEKLQKAGEMQGTGKIALSERDKRLLFFQRVLSGVAYNS